MAALVGASETLFVMSATIHRWDAELAVGDLTPIDPVVASDGIDEYFELMLPRKLVRPEVLLPDSVLQVRCTDTSGEWTLSNEDGTLSITRELARGDGSLRGPAEPMLLELWGRGSPRSSELSTVGDPEVLGAWLGLEPV